MELNKLYNMDCLIGMQEIPSCSVDLIKRGIPKPTRAQHFLAFDCVQFSLCTFETYDLLDRLYGISKWGGIGIFANWRKYKPSTQKSTAAFSICRRERRAPPTS